MEVMYQLLLVVSENNTPPADNGGAVPSQDPAPAEQSVNLVKTIGIWMKSNPVLTALIILAIAIAAFILFKYFKNKSRGKVKSEVVNSTMENSNTLHVNTLPVSIGNTHHIGARESQQDSFGISDISNSELCDKKGVFAVVADGMGGLSNGGEISAIVTSSMLKYYNQKVFHSTSEIELLNMVSTANEAVNRHLGRDGKGKSGSTVVSVILKNKELYWIAVGDSRICLIRNGALIQVNREHTYGPDLDEKAAMGEISYEEAQRNPQRTALTSYLGMGKLEKIDRNIRPLQLVSGDRIILMSDGVFGTLSDEEILSIMDVPPYESTAKLEQMVLSKQRPKQDNFTAVILECL